MVKLQNVVMITTALLQTGRLTDQMLLRWTLILVLNKLIRTTFTNFGRNSYDGLGTALYSYVNDPTYIDNAFWDGSNELNKGLLAKLVA